ncbi:hypothetical protein ABE096_03025 [Robertmurraya massiliosenegalensis]
MSMWNPLITSAEELSGLNIVTNESKIIFKLDNLKPGDIAKRELTVQNRSKEDFTYTSDSTFTGGSEELYNEFTLEIADSSKTLFSGKMKDFDRLDPRYLKSLHEEALLFSVEFPSHLGNEFQGKGFEVQIRFFAEGQTDNPQEPNEPQEPETPANPNEPVDPNDPEPQRPIPSDDLDSAPTDGQILPDTATNIFNYLVWGVVFIALGLIILKALKNRRVTVNN